MDRIKKLCSYLSECESFADVGCDHGYCTLYMLKNDMCKTAVVSDVSRKCLKKAETLLKEFIKSGKVVSVCCNGLEKIDCNTEQILIAGMGGEEIINILKTAYIPRSFVFQPMKNERKLRKYLLDNGAEITADEPFECGGKYYFVIKGKKSGNKTQYSQAELDFGKNIKSAETKAYIGVELQKKLHYLERDLNAEARADIEKSIEYLKGVLQNEA